MAGIERPGASQGRQHGTVELQALALHDHRAIPEQLQPAQVGENGLLGLRPHPGPVEIIESQQPATVDPAGIQPTQQRRAQVAEMERATGRGGKAAAAALLAQTQPRRQALLQGIGKHDGGQQPKSGPSRPPDSRRGAGDPQP